MSNEPAIWLQPNEEEGTADCGCRLVRDHIHEAYLGITSALEGPGNADFEDLSLIRDHIDLARADLAAEREKCDTVSCDLAAERFAVGRLEFRLAGLEDNLVAEREKVRVLREALRSELHGAECDCAPEDAQQCMVCDSRQTLAATAPKEVTP